MLSTILDVPIIPTMMSLKDQVVTLYSSGNPGFRNLYLVNDARIVFSIIFTYALFVTVIGKELMKNREPITFRKLMVAYNFFIVLCYFQGFVQMVVLLPRAGLKFFCGLTFDIFNNPETEFFLYLAWKFHVIKFLELVDTVFLVLSKKFESITTLHVIHHTTVPILTFTYIRCDDSTNGSFYAVINSFVHIIMYTYYGISALGPKYKKYVWWKRYLTRLQITQFVLVILNMAFIHYAGCAKTVMPFVFTIIMTIVFLVLFIKYYVSEFLHRRNNPKGTSTEKQNGFLHGEDALESRKGR